MSEPIDHHYVSQFLLSGWCRQDGRLAVFSHKGNRFVVDWHTPKYTGYEPKLYSISALPQPEQQWVEQEIMSKVVDGPASLVLQRMRAGELANLSADEMSVWVRFILAQWIRSPTDIAKLRREGSAALLRALEANPEEYEILRGDAPETTLVEWVQNHTNGLDEIVALGRVLPKLISDEEAGNIIIRMRWEVFHLPSSSVPLLTSDQPVVRLEGLKSRDCLIVIPLDPYRLFVANNYDRGLRRSSPDKIAKAMNKTMVQAARFKVFGSSEQHKRLVEKWLGHDRG